MREEGRKGERERDTLIYREMVQVNQLSPQCCLVASHH